MKKAKAKQAKAKQKLERYWCSFRVVLDVMVTVQAADAASAGDIADVLMDSRIDLLEREKGFPAGIQADGVDPTKAGLKWFCSDVELTASRSAPIAHSTDAIIG
jgi:hypothetical protein